MKRCIRISSFFIYIVFHHSANLKTENDLRQDDQMKRSHVNQEAVN